MGEEIEIQTIRRAAARCVNVSLIHYAVTNGRREIQTKCSKVCECLFKPGSTERDRYTDNAANWSKMCECLFKPESHDP